MFRSRSQQTQLPLESSSARPIVVHQFSAYSDSFSDHDFIARARLAAGHESSWINASRPLQTAHSTGDVFELELRPPSNTAQRSLRYIPDWNVNLHFSDDIVDLGSLSEFENTDLKSLFVKSTPKRSYTEESVQQNAAKRRKLDMSSLCNVIAQPHVLTSTASGTPKKSSIAPYSKCESIPIPPHSLPLPPPVPYTRRSWIIPVRGSLPWQFATSAVIVLDGSKDPPEPPDPVTHDELTWTSAALRSFWAFLLILRDKHTVGPIGLSFNVTSNIVSYSQPSYTELSGMGAQPLFSHASTAPSVISSSHSGSVGLPLPLVDHIKVYHDATQSMQLRTVFDVWAFEFGQGRRKMRLLKGARLVLLDERSKGVLVS
ncbi:hypothetical protein R3P38DRAFT_3551540 [Favolaschia claudopus]|uniref:Uncharacterized protein n=1 Tax=Favolaschia claudopus TaxID=2862362 RepID=A0AAW0B251_9AGAR